MKANKCKKKRAARDPEMGFSLFMGQNNEESNLDSQEENEMPSSDCIDVKTDEGEEKTMITSCQYKKRSNRKRSHVSQHEHQKLDR